MNDWSPEDPRWTAYVLDELAPELRAEADARLQDDPALRQQIDHLRETTELLRNTLEAPVPGDVDIVAKCREALSEPASPSTRSPLMIIWPTAIAAMLAIGLGINYMVQWGPRSREDQTRPAPAAFPTDSDVETEAEAFRDGADDPLMQVFRAGEPARDEIAAPALSADPPAPAESRAFHFRAEPEALLAEPAPESAPVETFRRQMTHERGRASPPPARPAPPPAPAADAEAVDLLSPARLRGVLTEFMPTGLEDAEAPAEDVPDDAPLIPTPTPTNRVDAVTIPLRLPTPTPLPPPHPTPHPEDPPPDHP